MIKNKFRQKLIDAGRTPEECDAFFAELSAALGTKDIDLIIAFCDWHMRVPETRAELFAFLSGQRSR